MASSESNEYNSQLSSSIDKSMSRKSFYEHEESLKSNQMASKKLSNSSDGKEHIEDMDEKELKHLLDEAITFRNPRDANEKSETFKRLLQNVTDEDERARKFENSGLNFWKAQSNSLQSLIDDSNFNQLPIHQSHTSSKKHQQRRKNSTSVSTRRVEGGSLPVDMHHSSSAIQSPPDQPFLSELKNNKKRQKEKQKTDFVIDMGDNETDERKHQRIDKDKENSSFNHDAIEMKTFANRSAVEHHMMMSSDDQNISKYTSASIAPNTVTTMASMMSSPISTSMINTKVSSSPLTSVDSSIPYTQLEYNKYTTEKPKSYQQAQVADTMIFSTVNHSNNILLAGGSGPNYGSTSSGGKIDQALPLPAGSGISSVMDSKSSSFTYNAKNRQQSREEMPHTSLLQTTPQMSLNSNPQTTSNSGGSSKDPKAKKRAAKSERNEKTIDVQSIEGFCGHETVEALLSYIDGDKGNSGNQKSHPKNGLLTSQAQLLNSDEKKKKMVAKNKEKVNKLKKSNSMDELCSTGRQEEQNKVTANKIAQDSAVTLRSKSSITKKSLGGEGGKEGKESKTQQQSKRNERRSWGTEGLSWPDSNAILPSSNNNEEEQHENETSSSSSSSGVQLDIQETNSANNNNINPTVNSNSTNINSSSSNTTSSQMEMSISAEAEKFQLVSKKRKFKRKSSEAPEFKTSTTTTPLSTTTPVVNNNNNLYSMTRGGRGENSLARTTGTKSTYNDGNRSESRKKPMISHDAKQTVTQNTASHSVTSSSQNSKSRRKSTSSMPHSEEGEEGEYSDGGDSVQSLPIETTKTTSSLLSAPHANMNSNNPPLPTPASNSNNNNLTLTSAETKSSSKKNPIVHQQFQLAPQQQVVQQALQKPTTFSYADIAKTSSNRQSNLGNNVIAAASTEKWPSISSSSSHQHQQQNANSSTDPFALSNYDGGSNKQQQPKVTAASITSSSTMSFPDLVESNNNRNKQLSNSNNLDAQLTTAPPMSTLSVATSTALNGDALQTELNGMVFMCDVHAGIDPDRINNNSQKISYSQSLLENHHNHELDANGNAQLLKNTEGAVVINSNSTSKNVLIKSKSVDHNNLSSIEHYPALEKTKQTLSDVLSKPIESLVTKGKQKQFNKAIATTTTTIVAPVTIVDDGKTKKKDRIAQKKHVSTSTSPPSSQPQNFGPQTQNYNHNHHQRPAVIIMNDSASFENTTELGITFGFDINEHLLCGHQNGDAIMMADDHMMMNVESSSNNANNNNNCDIMNTNLSSNNNLSNNQSCGIELYENYMVTTALHGDHHPTIIHTSSPESSCNNIDLGYMSSSILINTTQSPPANQIISNQQSPHMPQISFDNGPHERDFGLQVTPMEIQQQTNYEATPFVPAPLPRFILPSETTKNFNYEELVTFVSEEWTKAQRNGIFFNGQ